MKQVSNKQQSQQPQLKKPQSQNGTQNGNGQGQQKWEEFIRLFHSNNGEGYKVLSVSTKEDGEGVMITLIENKGEKNGTVKVSFFLNRQELAYISGELLRIFFQGKGK